LAPRAGPLPSGTESTGDTLTRPPARAASWPTPRRIKRGNEYIPLRSVFDDQAEPASAPQVAAVGSQVPQGHIGPTVWPAVHVPGEQQRERVGGPDEHSDRVVIGDLAELAVANLNHVGVADVGPARRGRWRTASRSALSPGLAAWPLMPSATATASAPHIQHPRARAGPGWSRTRQRPPG
jgi:hypothetical protein